MATIKLKKPGGAGAPPPANDRPPVRGVGAGVKGARPTLAQAQAQRAEREARYQEQLRQRFGDRPPEAFVRRGDAAAPAQRPAPTQRSANTAFGARHEPRSAPRQQAPRDDARMAPLQRDPRSAPRAQPQRAARDSRDAPRTQPPRDPRAAPPRPSQARFDPRPPPRPAPRNAARNDARAERRPRHDDDADDRFEHTGHPPGSLRLSKRMSELGIASRREADEWIAKGYVRVDDQVVSELGSRVLPQQRITIDAKAKFQQAQRVTVLVNKPVGYVSGQAEDGYEPAVVLITPANQWRDDRSGTRFLREHLKSLVPAGRLDIDSVGLLVLTQDGRVAKQLIGEDSEIEKEYLVRVDGPREGRFAARADGRRLSDEGLALLRHGLELDGEALRPAQVEWVNDDQLRFVLTQGKKRQIRRMCEAVGLQVLGLKRVRIGQVMLGDLPPGQWRYLRADEAFA
ncbi:MAG: pseudouridine synthase [Pseudomonadota bacterium]